MAIALGSVDKNCSTSGSGATPWSTPGVTTTTGSTFVAHMVWLDDKTFTSFSDTIGGSASGNTWTQFGTEVDSGTGVGDGGRYRIYYCQGGNGGASHVFSLAMSGAPSLVSLWVAEIKGAAALSFDKGVGPTHDTSTPFSSGATATTTQANEMIVGFGALTDYNATATHASSGSTPSDGNWSIAIEETNVNKIAGVIMYAIVSATGAYTFSFTEGDASATGYATTLTFKEATLPLAQISL